MSYQNNIEMAWIGDIRKQSNVFRNTGGRTKYSTIRLSKQRSSVKLARYWNRSFNGK